MLTERRKWEENGESKHTHRHTHTNRSSSITKRTKAHPTQPIPSRLSLTHSTKVSGAVGVGGEGRGNFMVVTSSDGDVLQGAWKRSKNQLFFLPGLNRMRWEGGSGGGGGCGKNSSSAGSSGGGTVIEIVGV